MKKLIAIPFVGALALLFTSLVQAATITVTPSTTTPVQGTTFQLIVDGAGFPNTIGATLSFTFNASVRVDSITTNAPSPFTGGIAGVTFPLNAPGGEFTLLAPTSGTLPSGSFQAFQINLTAVSSSIAGGAGGMVLQNGFGAGFSDEFFAVIPVTYTQANVTVQPAVIPAPAAAWLIAPAVLAAGRFSRRRKAA